MADKDPGVTRRRFFRLAGAGAAGLAGVAGLAAGGWAAEPGTSNAIRDPDLLPGDAAHAWMRAVYDMFWHANDSTPTGAARTYCLLTVAMYESVAPASSSLRSLVGQLTDL